MRRWSSSGSRWTGSPGREDAARRADRNRPWDYIIGSVHFIADRAVDHDGYDIWESSDPDEVWTRLLHGARRGRRERPVRRAGAPGSGEGVGDGHGRTRRGRAAPTTRSRCRRSRPRTLRSRSRPPGCASRWGRSIRRRELLRMCVAAGKPVALSSDAHEPETIGYGYDAGGRAVARRRRGADLRVRAAASAARSRSDEREQRGGHRLRLSPVRGVRRAAGAGRGRGSRASPAWRATRTPTSSSHSLTDALLGAAGLGDIGDHFPDDDPRWAAPTASSCWATCASRCWPTGGWRAVNADLTVLAERPRLAPLKQAMAERLAAALGVEPAAREREGDDERGHGLHRARRGHRACWRS